MTVFRALLLTLACGLLAACDDSPKPPAPAPKPSVMPPASQPQQEVSKPKAATRPAPAKAPATSKPAAPAEPLPPVKIDLSLPDELVQQLEPGEPLEASAEQPLLPEMFGEKPTEPGPYELNGRLITNDKSTDYWDSVEGAELQIKIRN